MKKYILIVSFLVLPLFIFSKEEIVSSPKESVKQDSIKLIDKNIPNELYFLDIIGNLYGITLCYEKNIYRIDSYQRLYFHTGIGVGLGFNTFIVGYGVPISMNYVLGENYCLELGFGTLLYGKFYNNEDGVYNNDLIKIIGDISYRYQFKTNYGYSNFFKIGITNTYQFNPSPWNAYMKFFPALVISAGF